jgi:hypothetical protein
MATVAKLERKIVKFATLIADKSENFRRDYDPTDGLLYDIRDNWAKNGQLNGLKGVTGGLEEAIVCERMPDGLHVRKGFRRHFMVELLNQQYPKGWQPEGSPDIYLFDQVEVVIHEGLTEGERLALTLDHGNRKPLTAAELAVAFFALCDKGFTEKQSVTKLHGLMEQTDPMSPKDQLSYNTKVGAGTPPDVAYLAVKKGWVDGRKRVYHSPMVLREAYLKRLESKQSWPTDAEVKLGYTHHMADFEADKMNVTRTNPGPSFKKFWDELVATKATAVDGNKPKTKSMLGPKDMLNVHQGFNSPLSRAVSGAVLAEVDRAVLKAADELNLLVGEIAEKFDKWSPEELTRNLDLLRKAVKTTLEFGQVKVAE